MIRKDPGFPELGAADYDATFRRVLKRNHVEIATQLNTSYPFFIADRNGTNQSLTVDAADAVVWSVVTDTHGHYSATSKRWIPLLYGYYFVDFSTAFQAAAWASGFCYSRLLKNGSQHRVKYVNATSTTPNTLPSCGGMVQMNGSTDYLEFKVENSGTPTTPVLLGNTDRTYIRIHYLGK